MPADYTSTARALSLPVSPPESPSLPRHSDNSRYGGRRSVSGQRSNRSQFSRREGSFLQRLATRSEQTGNQVIKLFLGLSWWQQIVTVLVLLWVFVLGILFLVYNQKFFAWLGPVAEKWRNLPGGWLIIWVLTFICAFPPMIGYSTSLTIAGFVYGFPRGWFIIASATVVGSFCAFITSKTFFSAYAQRLAANDRRFNALAATLKQDGLKLLIMIRLCPLPYSLSNGVLSTFPSVQPVMFALATAIATPRLMIVVFIGGRLAQLAETGEKMDAKTKAINYLSIVLGSVVGIGVSWFIYQRTMARTRQIEAEEQDDPDERQHDVGVESFTDDPEAHIGAADLRGADDISLFENAVDGGYRDSFDGDDTTRDEEEGNSGSDRGKKSPSL